MKMVKIEDMIFSDAYIQMFDLLDDCVLVVDVEGKVVLYNKANEKLDGLKREDVIGKHLFECFKIDRFSSSTMRTLETKNAYTQVYQDYITILGRRIASVSSSYPLMKNREMLGVLTITKDITRYKEMLQVFHQNQQKSGEEDKGSAHYHFSDILGGNAKLLNSIHVARMSSQTNSNILIYGETGTGKELFAQSIHNDSPVSGQFVSINCAAIPENLLESLLFGTSKGAFTGAVNNSGLFEEASGGTLFLDELNSMSLNLQSKLLRAIETGKIRRVGETKERICKPRIISALNIHPYEAIESNVIRRDLFYRLGVISVVIPPLRERMDDLELLTEEFIAKYNLRFQKNIQGLAPKVKELFLAHDWPGNVRELEHAIEHSMIVAGDDQWIEQEHIPIFLTESFHYSNEKQHDLMDRLVAEAKVKDMGSVLEGIEKNIIEQALVECGGNVARAAKNLGMNRQTLDYRIKKLL